MKHEPCWLAGLLGSFLLIGCAATERVVQPPPVPIRYVEPDDAMMLVSGREHLLGRRDLPAGVFVDVREAHAYEAGHLQGAVPWSRLDPDAGTDLQVGYDLPQAFHELLIVYGDDFEDARAEQRAERLADVFMLEVYILRGGLSAWKAAGNPIIKGPMKQPDS